MKKGIFIVTFLLVLAFSTFAFAGSYKTSVTVNNQQYNLYWGIDLLPTEIWAYTACNEPMALDFVYVKITGYDHNGLIVSSDSRQSSHVNIQTKIPYLIIGSLTKVESKHKWTIDGLSFTRYSTEYIYY